MVRLTMIFIFGNTFFILGCAGPKFMSNAMGNHQAFMPIPKTQKAIILPFEDPNLSEKIDTLQVGAYFATCLMEKLLASGLFSQVVVGEVTPDSNSIIISGSLMSLGKKSWGSRVFVENEQMTFGVMGEIQNGQQNKLLSFTKSRSAQGGLVGAGGWFAAGSGQMAKQLVNWVAADIVKIIQKERTK